MSKKKTVKYAKQFNREFEKELYYSGKNPSSYLFSGIKQQYENIKNRTNYSIKSINKNVKKSISYSNSQLTLNFNKSQFSTNNCSEKILNLD